ncbi:MAG: LD-carboxypeptidase [Lentisphaeria bacterium]|nr:LD-carboxypeptidase [Lentisphaeria bacterium]
MYDSRYPRLTVISPGSMLKRAEVEAGTESLRSTGHQVRWMPHLFTGDRLSHLAAPAADRAADLEAAWLSPDTDAILCARGGGGSAQLLPLLDWEKLRRRPDLPLIGYSDITALHFGMLKMGVGLPVVAPMLGLYQESLADGYAARAWQAAFSGGVRRVELPPGDQLTFYRKGSVTALPVSGNITVAASLCGTGFLPSPRGRIVLLEDVDERVSRLDRLLTQLAMNGFFEDCAGIVFGQFTDCDSPLEEQQELCARATAWTKGPVCSGFPFGHQLPFTVLNLRQQLCISSDGI